MLGNNRRLEWAAPRVLTDRWRCLTDRWRCLTEWFADKGVPPQSVIIREQNTNLVNFENTHISDCNRVPEGKCSKRRFLIVLLPFSYISRS
jgi:hypothetical protein